MNRLVIEVLAVGGQETVLEVGFGGGALLGEWLERTRGSVIGVDVSSAMVDRARRRLGPALKADRLRLIQASVETLPVETASVDKAASVNSLYFWPDPAASLVELARVIRPGGRLALCFEPAAELRKWPGHVFGFRSVDEEEARSWMVRAGFDGLDVREGFGRKPDRYFCLTGRRM